MFCECSLLKLNKYSLDASPDFLKFGYNGYNDTLSVLLPCDDAATVNWGSNWRTPTYDEWVELAENCTAAYINQDSVCGILYTGPNGNTLFLPGTGKYFDSNYTGWVLSFTVPTTLCMKNHVSLAFLFVRSVLRDDCGLAFSRPFRSSQ